MRFRRSVEGSREVVELLRDVEPTKLRVTLAKLRMLDLNGQFRPVSHIPKETRSIIAQEYAYSEWARIALDVANQYSEGDYFEFGSEGLNTLCNFLVAFHLNGHDLGKPEVKCFAFDIFGDPPPGVELDDVEAAYFEAYTKGSGYYSEMKAKLHDYGIMEGRVELVKGFFKDSLNNQFKQRLRREGRRVGFAFLDCNLPSSYATVLDFLEEFIHPTKSFVYLDEYYQFPEVANLFDSFCDNVRDRYGLKPRFVRTAGAYGALYRLME